MKLLVIFVLIIAIKLGLTVDQDDLIWQRFKYNHKKIYHTLEEEEARHELFLLKLNQIRVHNEQYDQGLFTYKKGINRFSDWTQEEISAYLTRDRFIEDFPQEMNNTILNLTNKVKLPDAVDWRDKGAVTEVKDEGNCKSSWSFSVTGTLEGILKINHYKLISLSEQNLIDCSQNTDYYNNPYCHNAGSRAKALRYVINYGIESESDYPYTNSRAPERCQFDLIKSVMTVQEYNIVPTKNKDALRAVVAVQPVSVKIHATCSFIDYKSGIFMDIECKSDFDDLNRGLLVVGYGSENGVDYWIIKNSVGADWGENGYAKMIRNKDNNCGIATSALYPVSVP